MPNVFDGVVVAGLTRTELVDFFEASQPVEEHFVV